MKLMWDAKTIAGRAQRKETAVERITFLYRRIHNVRINSFCNTSYNNHRIWFPSVTMTHTVLNGLVHWHARHLDNPGMDSSP